VTGASLHAGSASRVTFRPAPVNTGIVFRRLDRPGAAPIPALADRATRAERRTVLGAPDGIDTVEHILAALRAAAIDDVEVGVDGPEPPFGDGSAAPWLTALTDAGSVAHGGMPTELAITTPLVVTDGESRYVVSPSPSPRLTVTIDFDHPLIGRQTGCWDLTPEIIANELGSSRSFGFAADYDGLRAKGLALGATKDNVLILTPDALMAGQSLHWPDEFVRHKALDLVGDLMLVGGPIKADISAFHPSHAGNVTLARTLRRVVSGSTPVFGIQDILGTLPHRYPMLLVDRILEVHGRERIVGLKNVTINEPFFQGHFPGHPIMPGVLIVEAMAQCGGMLLMGAVEQPETKVVYFMSIDGVKFRRPVVPGDQLRLELAMLQFRGTTCRMRGTAFVDGQVAAEAEMMAAIMDR
jgi:UDP-3-O-[3-hydroxymyristoyl] N-acetylglucosamine deacetylase/3-hydroxyacyl-[acyl-carrier-protein] dehydratase